MSTTQELEEITLHLQDKEGLPRCTDAQLDCLSAQAAQLVFGISRASLAVLYREMRKLENGSGTPQMPQTQAA